MDDVDNEGKGRREGGGNAEQPKPVGKQTGNRGGVLHKEISLVCTYMYIS